MHSYFLAAIGLGVVPLVVLAHRHGWLERRWGRWGLALVGLGLLAVTFPVAGLGLEAVKKLKLFLAAAAVVLVWLRIRRIGWGRRARAWLLATGGLAVAAFVVDLDFGAFHGARTWVHWHDLAHYYLGSKYFSELGYDGLYTGMLRAEAEVYENHFKTLQARDLARNELVHVRDLLVVSEPVKAAFSPERWEAFKRDVSALRETLGPLYPAVLVDHGFNATPFWAAVGGALASQVPAGDVGGMTLLTALDVVLVAALLAALGWGWGPRALLLGAIFFALCFGAGFSWTGGAFLRYEWLAATAGAVACLRRRRPVWAGALLAGATLLRVFPVFFAAGPLFLALWQLVDTGKVSREPRRFLLAFAASTSLLFLVSGWPLGGFASWKTFWHDAAGYRAIVSPNAVGLTRLLTPERIEETSTIEDFRAGQRRRSRIYGFQLATLFPLALAFCAWRSRRSGLAQTAILGWIPLFVGLNLPSYYFVGLVLLVPLGMRRSDRLSWLFGGEAVLYGLQLFEPSQALTFVYRSLEVLWLLIGVWGKRRI